MNAYLINVILNRRLHSTVRLGLANGKGTSFDLLLPLDESIRQFYKTGTF